MYVILTSAKKNVGDFLIRDRAIKLLKHLKPKDEFVEYNSWEPLDKYLDVINKSKGIIICGGPGYLPNVYPEIYPLTKNLDDIKVPIYILGAGWYGLGIDSSIMKRYSFTEQSRMFFNKIVNSGGLSTRDLTTQKVLSLSGYKQSIFTGCPVMFNIPYIGKKPEYPKEIRKIVFTTPQESIFFKQSIEVLRGVREMYPEAIIYCSFHRGIVADKYTSKREEKGLTKIKEAAMEFNCIIKDTSYDLDKISFYSDCDIHIGYRVHAHLYFLSERKPSILINEDGRGSGFTELLGEAGIDGYRISSLAKGLYSTKNKKYMRVAKRLIRIPKPWREVFSELQEKLLRFKKNNFNDLDKIYGNIDKYYEEMKKFVDNI